MRKSTEPVIGGLDQSYSRLSLATRIAMASAILIYAVTLVFCVYAVISQVLGG